MSVYQNQRTNMVDSQLRTNEVTDHRILQAMLDLPREKFVPEDKVGVAYMDRDILVDRDKEGFDRYMMSPVAIARLTQLASVDEKDMVLVVGCATGYVAALLGRLADSVVCLEQDERLEKAASDRLEELECDNAATVIGHLADGYFKEGPYDVILVNGGVEVIPQSLFEQLKDGGRLVAVELSQENVGRAHLYRKIGDEVGENRVSFDAQTHLLPGFAQVCSFTFN